jgi:hypothetical protein
METAVWGACRRAPELFFTRPWHPLTDLVPANSEISNQDRDQFTVHQRSAPQTGFDGTPYNSARSRRSCELFCDRDFQSRDGRDNANLLMCISTHVVRQLLYLPDKIL